MASPLVRTLLLASSLAVASPLVLDGQLVPIRTVPVASGDQFLTLPVGNVGMGGVRLAVDDSIGDPWVNPAKGVFLRESVFIGSPTFYSISQSGGGGKTFPLTGLFRGDAWFGGASLALQQIDDDPIRGRNIWVDPLVQWIGPPRRLSEASSRNLYANGLVGRELDGGWSIGVAASVGHLDAVDGVDLLYAGSERIEQSGSVSDVRLGLYRVGERDRLSIVAVHNRVSMTHDVSYIDFVWDDPMTPPEAQLRLEVNEDKTRTWGGQLAWDRDLEAPGWRIGAAATLNRKSHPKIPNYEIQNIPRDPGTTWAYEAGFGMSRTRGPTVFGVDVVLQPIWSETWQEAEEETETSQGGVIPVGGRTIDNDFFFTNVVLRAGLSHEIDDDIGFQAGLEVRSYDYTLEQRNHVEVSFREQDESWMEWSPTFGLIFRFSELELRYGGRLTTGTGQPGTARQFAAAAEDALSAGSDFIVAPEAPLTLQDASVFTHQLSVHIPIR